MDKRTNVLSGARGRMALVAIAFAALSACSNDGNDSNPAKFSIGGTTSGLNGTVVLQNNGGNNLTVTSNGAFTFTNKVAQGGAYSVTVSTQPASQTCTVANGSGTASADVTTVVVTCIDNSFYTIGGTISGLTGTVVLRYDPYAFSDESFATNGNFAFAEQTVAGNLYNVVVVTQPSGQTCAVTNGLGTVPAANVTNVAVTCTSNPPPAATYSIGGNVSGLSGGTLQLGLQHSGNMGNSIDVTANGPFNFDPDKVWDGDAYWVSVVTQPSGQTCALTNGTGTVAGAAVTNVSVSCSASTATFTLGGTITGLKGAGLKIEDTAANSVTVASNATTFTLPNPVGNNVEYDVGISQQPLGQTCVLLKSHGVVNSANVANVDVRCIDNVTTPLVGTYTIPALSANDTSYVYITLFADGVYIYGSVENHAPCGENDGNGVEYGVYNFNVETGQFTIKSAVVDTNGACGLWDSNGSRIDGPLSRTGTPGQGRVLTLTTGLGQIDLVPVASTTGEIVGSWSPTYQKSFVAFLPAGDNSFYTFWAETQADTAPTSIGFLAGVEYACAQTTALTEGTITRNFTSFCLAPAPSVYGVVDTNGTAGLSSIFGTTPFTVSTDTLTTSEFQATRIKPN